MTRIAVLTPSIDGRVDALYALSLFKSASALEDVELVPFMTLCDANLGHARDVLLGLALDAHVDGLLWIDSDHGWTPDDVMEIISTGEDFVAGVTPMKGDPKRWPGKPALDNAAGDDSCLIEMEYVGLGFTYMSTGCATSLWESGREYVARGVVEHRVFGFEIDDAGRMAGEDVSACRLWRRMGGHVYAHVGVAVDHVSYREVLAAPLAEGFTS